MCYAFAFSAFYRVYIEYRIAEARLHIQTYTKASQLWVYSIRFVYSIMFMYMLNETIAAHNNN